MAPIALLEPTSPLCISSMSLPHLLLESSGLWGGSAVLAAPPPPPHPPSWRAKRSFSCRAASTAQGLHGNQEPCAAARLQSPATANAFGFPLISAVPALGKGLWSCMQPCSNRSSMAGLPAGYRRARAACILGSVIAGNQLSVKQ